MDRFYPHIPDTLLNILKMEFPDCAQVHQLFDEYFQHHTYDRRFALRLLEAARQNASNSWEIRRLAALMLQHQLLQLSMDEVAEFDFLLTELKLKANEGSKAVVNDSLLKEGYSTTDLIEFIAQFRQKLERQNRVLRLMQGAATSESALRDFIHLSRQECKLSLGRYLWTAQEVVERILRQVRRSKGMKDLRPMLHPYTESEAERTLSKLPDFEAEIIRRLSGMGKIFWVADSTSSEVNALVEYPLKTVVLVIKPPGSDLEIEVKRAGARGEQPLNVFYARNGEPVPVTHRLHAGSMGEYLRWDASASAIFSQIYRLVHGTEAPISKTVSLATIYTVPVKHGEEHILRYFTDSRVFGEGYNRMRAAMEDSIAAFKRERDWRPSQLVAGDLGRTTQFLSLLAPGQAILVNTTSYRLDLLAKYLSPDGPRLYFEEGLGIEYTDSDAKRFADGILDEVLGIYIAPPTDYKNHQQYLKEVFSVPQNRRRADDNFLSIMRDIGLFWGTLLAVRGFTRGESFVGRNVGLKGVWEDGEWKVKIIFMDHDDMDIAGKNSVHFYPRAAFAAIADDEIHIFGGVCCGEAIKGEVAFLQEIYRVEKEVSETAQVVIRQAIEDAYKKTRHNLLHNPNLQAYFHEVFIERISDWDTIAARYLKIRHDASAIDSWKLETKEFLSRRGYTDRMIDDHLCAVDSFDDFLTKYSFLY
jgi:hypothetical protein